MESNFLYFDAKHAIEVHDIVINQSGGLNGVVHSGLLESVLGHIRNDRYYPELEDKLTYLVFSFIKNHAFVDGNKRSGIALGAYFLQINSFAYCVKIFIEKMENIAVWVAENKINKELLKDIIASIIYEDDYSEALKLRLVVALEK